MAKLTVKEVQEIVGVKTAGLPDEQKQFVNSLLGAFTEAINKSLTDIPDTAAMNEALKPFQGADGVTLDSLSKETQELVEQVKGFSEALDKLQKKGVSLSDYDEFLQKFDEMYESPKFKDFMNGNEKDAKGFSFKDVSLTGNINTPHANAQHTGIVVSAARNNTVHIRDFAAVLPGDPAYPIFPYQQIYDVDKNARYVAENGTLPESSLKVKEVSAEVKRCGTHIKMSKRALRNKVWLQGYVRTMLIAAVRDAEDAAILFGDGSGDNVKGITTYDGVKSVESIIGTSIFTIAAGGVKSIEKAENGLIVELKEPNDYLMDGLKITGESAVTNTTLNKTYDVIKLNDRRILLEGASFASTNTDELLAADVAAVKFTVYNGLKGAIESPNSVDALECAISVMNFAQYKPTILIVNPLTLTSILAEKATNGNRLEVVKDLQGNAIIGGLRVMTCNKVPMGKYFLGDMVQGANIIDYTPLTLDWKDDVETALKNQIVLIAQEEIIVPVMMPFAFSYGSIASLKTAIKKAS